MEHHVIQSKIIFLQHQASPNPTLSIKMQDTSAVTRCIYTCKPLTVLGYYKILCVVCESHQTPVASNTYPSTAQGKKATIHQLTTFINVLFLCHNHLLTMGLLPKCHD